MKGILVIAGILAAALIATLAVIFRIRHHFRDTDAKIDDIFRSELLKRTHD